jgi:Rps23 Pro-64 3,4-dihydroxylase Tpa1-like proline 4-hydroxylase
MPYINNYLYTNNDAICTQLCNEIIELFEEQSGKYEGVTAKGLDKNIKDSMDFIIPRKDAPLEIIKKWERIDKFLAKELDRNVKKYIQDLKNNINIIEERSDSKLNISPTDVLITSEFMIQRYTQNKGRYVYHDDANIDWNNKKYRLITYLFYLNTVDEGGETEFWGELKIKPESGKLLLFPAIWVYPHRGMMPISSNKYIITGWLYVQC